VLSIRAKEAIKLAIAMTIAVGIALAMNWSKPAWAGFGVAMIALSTAGASLNKGAMRMLGTLLAAAVALGLLSWFPQERWSFVTFLSVYLGVCTYMSMGKNRQYFWFAAGFVCVIICVGSAGTLNPFGVVVERTQETATGVLVDTFVSVLLWPRSSRSQLETAARELLATQAQLFGSYLEQMSRAGEDARPLRLQEVQLLQGLRTALPPATTDSYEVWECRDTWRRLEQLSGGLLEALERWRASFPEIEQLDLTQLVPQLEGVCSELTLRFAEIQRVFAGAIPERAPQRVTLPTHDARLQSLTNFQRAAVAATTSQLNRLLELTGSLHECVRDLRGHGERASSSAGGGGMRFELDRERLQGAATAMVTLWAGFLLWVYVDPPGHASFVQLSSLLAMMVMMSGASPTKLVSPLLTGALFAGLLYVFVMPNLSGYGQLGPMIFGATFAIAYLFWQPQQGVQKAAGLTMLLTFLSLENQQSYSFAGYANSVIMVTLACALVIAVTYALRSPRPEKVYLRLLARFFRQADSLMSGLAPRQTQGRRERFWASLVRNDLLELPGKLATLAERIDYRALPGTQPEQVRELGGNLLLLALRIQELLEARERLDADPRLEQVVADLRSWRLVAQQQLRLWARDPSAALAPDVDLAKGLTARLLAIEDDIEEARTLAGLADFRVDPKSFYRYLGAFRGLSEAAIGHARVASRVSWDPWREARF